MSIMKEKALRVLEFTKIRDQLASFAVTQSGAQLCLALLPHDRLDDALQAQEETEEALNVLTFRGDHPLTSFKDVRDSLHLAQKGATLSPRTLLDVADCLRAAASARTALDTDKENTPILKQLASLLTPNYPLERKIKDAIISDEEIADNASPALADIRRHMRQCNDRVKEKLRSMIQSASYAKYLQEAIVTLRNGRYVIPVRQEFRQNVPGLVHDQSASGATLFIEPLSVVEAGNELKQWALKEQQEIERILSDFSAQVASQSDSISANIEIMTRLDFMFAKGVLAREMNAVTPKMNNKGRLRFVRVRHPLIDKAAVVPCDLWMGEEFTTLIITGPNTGGKTVTLKTVGLICLMAQSGLHVPGNLGTETAVFGQVFADIGDEQSIEQSLSTFSSHMSNIVRILEEVQPNDLVLFDELGAGTDPTEGAALAQAILSTLRMMEVRTVATTHYSELKAYALSTVGVENASVEFDVATLRPTFRLSIGVPGKSNAFEISQRLGLPLKMIETAKELLSNETIRFEDVIANAEYHRQIAQKERQLAQEAHDETIRLRKEAEELYQSIQSSRASAEKKAKEEARRILEKTKRESAAIIDELKMIKRDGGDISQGLSALQKRIQSLDDSLAEGMQAAAHFGSAPMELHIGDMVDIPHLNAVGSVLTKPDAKGEVMVQAGIIKMKIQANQLRLSNTAPARKSIARAKTQSAARSVQMECDVRGLALDEALLEVDRYLDMALLAGMHEVWIIHGKGTGTLRAGISQHLRNMPQVDGFRLGKYGEGESGVTVVELK